MISYFLLIAFVLRIAIFLKIIFKGHNRTEVSVGSTWQAKKNLRLPPSKITTPADLGRNPEDVLKYTPGYCFIDLLQSIDDDNTLKGASFF